MKYGFYDVSTKQLWDKRVSQAKANGCKWASDFSQRDISFEEAKGNYHGNSKLILHLFYNNITGRNEMQYTTKTIIKTYPQYKGKTLEVL